MNGANAHIYPLTYSIKQKTMVLSFTKVEIIEHPVVFDSSHDYKTDREGMFCEEGGPLLQLAWNAHRRTTVDIDVYEVT